MHPFIPADFSTSIASTTFPPFAAVHDGRELALIHFDLEDPVRAVRELLQGNELSQRHYTF